MHDHRSVYIIYIYIYIRERERKKKKERERKRKKKRKTERKKKKEKEREKKRKREREIDIWDIDIWAYNGVYIYIYIYVYISLSLCELWPKPEFYSFIRTLPRTLPRYFRGLSFHFRGRSRTTIHFRSASANISGMWRETLFRVPRRFRETWFLPRCRFSLPRGRLTLSPR